MRYVVNRPIAFVGIMGSGKSAVGRVVANRLFVPFHDTDVVLEDSVGLSIAGIFETCGEAAFRKMETETLEKLLGGTPAVVATGGGAFVSPRNRSIIHRHATSVWIDASIDTLWERVSGKTKRPLLLVDDPRSELERLLGERRPAYALASVRVPSDNDTTVQDMADRVVSALASSAGSGVRPA